MKTVLFDCDTIAYNNDVSLDCFKDFGEIEIYKSGMQEKTAELIKDADIVLSNKTVFNEENLKNANNLKYIGLFATGYNNIDLAAADKRGITVCNAGSYSTNAVAQHVFAFILNRFSRIYEYNTMVENGGWIKSLTFSPFVLPTEELAGKKLGIIGYGSIGKAVAKIALAFNMQVLVYTRTKCEDKNVSMVDFDTLLKTSDIISVHCPLTEKTKGMFNKNAFEKMKNGAFFINTSRGSVVNEVDLAQVLNSGKITAAVDVLEYEPMRENCPLIGAKGLCVTPHVAWAPLTTRKRVVQIVYDNIKCFLEGNPQNVVNNPRNKGE